ncbi:MAG: helix-turn-helix domain-containing protein [Candidatus Anammoxibacter sp.]
MWPLIQKLSMVLFTAVSADQVLKIFSPIPNSVKSDKIYSLQEVAELLDVDKRVVRDLIKSGDLKARKIKGKYKILGLSLRNFLSE